MVIKIMRTHEHNVLHISTYCLKQTYGVSDNPCLISGNYLWDTLYCKTIFYHTFYKLYCICIFAVIISLSKDFHFSTHPL